MDRRQQRENTVDLPTRHNGNWQVVDLLPESDPQSFSLQPAWHGDAGQLSRYSQHYLCVWRI
jgi:hypothetical protein